MLNSSVKIGIYIDISKCNKEALNRLKFCKQLFLQAEPCFDKFLPSPILTIASDLINTSSKTNLIQEDCIFLQLDLEFTCFVCIFCIRISVFYYLKVTVIHNQKEKVD